MPYRVHITNEELQAELQKMGYANLDDEAVDAFRKDILRMIKEDIRKIKKLKREQKSSSSVSEFAFSDESGHPLTSTPNTYSDLKSEATSTDSAEGPQIKKKKIHKNYLSTISSSTNSRSSSTLSNFDTESGYSEAASSELSERTNSGEVEKQKPAILKPKKAKESKLPTYPDRPDPVNLYHYYKAHWDKYKAPGEDPRTALRWKVRSKLFYSSEL